MDLGFEVYQKFLRHIMLVCAKVTIVKKYIEMMVLLMDSTANILQVTSEILNILWSYMNDRVIKEQDAALNR